MRPTRILATAIATTITTALLGACSGALDNTVATGPESEPPPVDVAATLLPGLGNHHFAITTDNPEAQRWFDQGFMLTYGFNHDAAERSFLKAVQLDPECAMCWWGAALVLGPHVNAGMDPANNASAWARLQRAVTLAPAAGEREQAFIQALSARYAANPPKDRRPLDEAYAEATRQLVAQRPDDLDAATFHAEALMDLQPWNYYDEQRRPIGNIGEIVATLESVIERQPDHAGALHLYVHAVEASAKAAEAEAVYREELERNPGNGWSLYGLAQALEAQDRDEEADEVERKLQEAWQYADVELVASRF